MDTKFLSELESLIGQNAAQTYQNEIEQAQNHHERMKIFVEANMPNARLLLIDNSERTQKEIDEWHAKMSAPILQALAATECTIPSSQSTAQRFAAMFGYQLGDKRLLRWHAPYETPTATLDSIDGIILTGSSAMVTNADTTPWMQRVIAVLQEAQRKNIPVLGICFGHQIMAKAFAGEVSWMKSASGAQLKEIGPTFVEYTQEGRSNRLFEGLEEIQNETSGFWVEAVHSQEVTTKPPTAALIATNAFSPMQAFAYEGGRMWSLQNHPENNAVLHDVLLHTHPEDFHEWMQTLSDEDKQHMNFGSLEELQKKNLSQPTWTARTRIFANFLKVVAECSNT